jgi:hypothetical protein
MKIARLLSATAPVLLVCGVASAQVDRLPSLQQPASVSQTAFEYDAYALAEEEAPSESPSDQPAPPPAEPQAAVQAPSAYRTCCPPRCRQCCCSDEGWTLPQPRFLACHDITIGGWIEQGITWNGHNPTSGLNGPVTFNDKDGEWLVNQIWFFMEKETDTGGYGFDVGGRVDFVWGTDGRFTQAADGLEANWNQTEPFYQAALPQFYFDIAWNDWTMRMGHFYTIIGYEVVTAPDNFFYSHAYTMQYGEPFTHTGVLFSYDLNDSWSFTGGMHRGSDQFDDTDGLNALNFLGGVTWTAPTEDLSIAFAITAEEQGPNIQQQIYSIVGSWDVTDRFGYVIQHDYGQQTNENLGQTAEWYGINQYFFYELTEAWDAGLRVEWFRDNNGTRVGSFQGDFYEITLGANWKPCPNLTVRPECRWDWFEPDPANQFQPYDSGNSNEQFLFGCDMIVVY